MRRLVLVAAILVLRVPSAEAQVVRSFLVSGPPLSSVPLQVLPPSNTVNDFLLHQGVLWVATEAGLATVDLSGSSWQVYANTPPFDGKSASAMAALDSIICVSTAYSQNVGDGTLPAGGGFYYSANLGTTWIFSPQVRDTGLVDTIRTYGATGIVSLAITTDVNNLTYDIALTHGSVWTANFAGMLRRSTNGGQSWNKVVLPPDVGPDVIRATDTLSFTLSPTDGKAGLVGNYNHRVFSVIAVSDSILWVGTAGGINRTTDAGFSWQKFTHENQSSGISGNFVVAIKDHQWGSRHVLWAASVNAIDPDEHKGVSFTEDNGASWTTTLLGEWAHNFAVRDSIVYVATDNGLFRSDDVGKSWLRSGSIIDDVTGQRFVSSSLYAVTAIGNTVWIGGPDGSAWTMDSGAEPFGTHWHVFRTYRSVSNTATTYAYPNPFSPANGVVRLHYRVTGAAGGSVPVTIRLFDFAMMPVRVLLHDALRNAQSEHDDVWDGRTDSGGRVANGVYFYRVESPGHEPAWGKVLVIQ